jgi:hypothetical protein
MLVSRKHHVTGSEHIIGAVFFRGFHFVKTDPKYSDRPHRPMAIVSGDGILARLASTFEPVFSTGDEYVHICRGDVDVFIPREDVMLQDHVADYSAGSLPSCLVMTPRKKYLFHVTPRITQVVRDGVSVATVVTDNSAALTAVSLDGIEFALVNNQIRNLSTGAVIDTVDGQCYPHGFGHLYWSDAARRLVLVTRKELRTYQDIHLRMTWLAACVSTPHRTCPQCTCTATCVTTGPPARCTRLSSHLRCGP